MKISAALLALAGSAAAFVPSSSNTNKATTSVEAANLQEFPGSTAPMPAFDPFGIADVGSDETFAWLQAVELKHSRVAMLASTGFLIQAAGIHFPGMISEDLSFASLAAMKPVEQWLNVPEIGKWHILSTIFVTEMLTEIRKPHYMLGGDMPKIVFPPRMADDITQGWREDKMNEKKAKELNNGRLAMVGMASFLSEYFIPGSVPILSSVDAF